MLNRAGLSIVCAIAGVAACGGASENDFGAPAPEQAFAGKGSGGSANGGTGGDATAVGGSSTGGTGATGGSADGGTAGDPMAAGGTAGDLMAAGGTAGDLMAAGGTAGDLMAAGGVAGDLMAAGGTAGDAMATGGTDPGAGGSGNATGGAGMATGGGAGKPGAGGTAGMPNCDELNTQYAETLQAAQACNANSGKEQCTDLVPGSLTCGCDVFVNPANADAVAELARLRKQGNECRTVCPAIACIAPEGGMCVQGNDLPKGQGLCKTGLATTL